MNLAERIERVSAGTASEAEAKVFDGCDPALAFARVSRSVRQSIVLEEEILGVRAQSGTRTPVSDAARGPSGAGRPLREPRDYRDFYDTAEFQEHLKRDEEIGRRIYEVLMDIRDGKLGSDQPDGPELEAKLEAGVDWSPRGIITGGKWPPGRGPP